MGKALKKRKKKLKIEKNKIFPLLMSLNLEHIYPKAPKIILKNIKP